MAQPTKPVRKATKPPVAPAAAPVAHAKTAVPVKSEPTGSKPAPRAAPSPAPQPPAAAPVAPPAPAAKEVTMDTIDTAKTAAENATAKAQTFVNEAGDRAKGALEKGRKLMEDAADFGRGNVEALVESSRIAARGLEALSHDGVAYAKKAFEEATATAKQMASVKSPTELLKLQADYARNAFDALVAESSARAETMLKLAGEVAQPISNRVALAAEKMKVSA
ncbi:phasin family protein [Sphingomonas sp. MMO-176]|uniref:phasin family protein n=2 Tax=Sphingomonas TaxID=13687 RepID=UPI000E1004F1|nr:hypothetical protein DM480_08330 [Sphingomonas sp. FARSPH]